MRPEEEIETLSRAILKEAQVDAEQLKEEARARAEAIRQRAQRRALLDPSGPSLFRVLRVLADETRLEGGVVENGLVGIQNDRPGTGLTARSELAQPIPRRAARRSRRSGAASKVPRA